MVTIQKWLNNVNSVTSLYQRNSFCLKINQLIARNIVPRNKIILFETSRRLFLNSLFVAVLVVNEIILVLCLLLSEILRSRKVLEQSLNLLNTVIVKDVVRTNFISTWNAFYCRNRRRKYRWVVFLFYLVSPLVTISSGFKAIAYIVGILVWEIRNIYTCSIHTIPTSWHYSSLRNLPKQCLRQRFSKFFPYPPHQPQRLLAPSRRLIITKKQKNIKLTTNFHGTLMRILSPVLSN